MEECKDAILGLSSREETFFGPYEMPLLNVQLLEAEEEETIEDQDGLEGTNDDQKDPLNDDGSVDDGGGEDRTIEVAEESCFEEDDNSRHYHLSPSEESREKLAKLEPLPPLLEDFDLDAHVGLIQNLLKEDPELVKMQATLSGR